MSDDSELVFKYANEADLEIHCSPFGLSGMYIKINGTNLTGIGSTMGLITGSTKGYVHYNDAQDLINKNYKLYVVVDEDDMLRIDFTKILHGEKQQEISEPPVRDENEVPSLIFRGKCPEGKPDTMEPFIGIFSFEKED